MIDYRAVQNELVGWLETLAPWDAFCTFTFELPVSVNSARRLFERWQKKVWPGVPCFYVVEWHGGGHQAHIHALFRLSTIRRKEVWKSWFNRYGRARLVPIAFVGGATGYCAKYCVKQVYSKGWWNLLQLVRNETGFVLR